MAADSDFLNNLPSDLDKGIFSILTSTNSYWQDDEDSILSFENENIDGWVLFDDHAEDIYYSTSYTVNTTTKWEADYTNVMIN